MSEPPPAANAPPELSRSRWLLLGSIWVGLWLGLWVLSSWLDVRPGISLFYAPAGLSLALLLYLGPRAWPLPLLAGLLPIPTLMGQLALTPMVLVTVAHALVYAGAAWTLRHLQFDTDLSRLHNTAKLLITALIAPIPLALFGAGLYAAADGREVLLAAAFSWWLGDLVGILAITPAALLLMPRMAGSRAATPALPQARPLPWTPLAVAGAALVAATLAPADSGAMYVAFLIVVLGSTVVFAAVTAGIHGTVITGCAAAVLLTWHIGRAGAVELAMPLQILLLLSLLSGLIMGTFVSSLWRLQNELEQRVREGVNRVMADRHIFQVVAEHTSDIITIHDANSAILYMSSSIERLLGHDPQQLLGPVDHRLLGLIHPEDRAGIGLPPQSDTGRLQLRIRDAGGHWHWLQCAYNRVAGSAHERWVAISRDVTEQIVDRDKLVSLAMHDPLTGLLNRRGLEREGRQEFTRALRYNRPLAAMLLDLDHFKGINDRLGHAAGDQILRQVADLLRRHVRNSELICRWGGEEFLVLLPETDLEGARPLAERIRAEAAAQEYLLNDVPVRCTLSCGLAQRLPDDEQLEQLIRRADEQLYEAKGSGRNRVLG